LNPANIREAYDLEWQWKKDESYEDWHVRLFMLEENLFIEINKYFKVKEEDKTHLYRYGGLLGKGENLIPFKLGCFCYDKNFKTIEVLQRAEMAK